MTRPATACDLALQLGASPSRVVGPGTLAQSGSMKLRLVAPVCLPFSTCQTPQVTHCAFFRRARLWPFGYLALLDKPVGGDRRTRVTAFGTLPLVRVRSAEALSKGQTQRSLAELPYSPDSMRHNPAHDSREIDHNRLAVATGSGPRWSSRWTRTIAPSVQMFANARPMFALSNDRDRSYPALQGRQA